MRNTLKTLLLVVGVAMGTTAVAATDYVPAEWDIQIPDTGDRFKVLGRSGGWSSPTHIKLGSAGATVRNINAVRATGAQGVWQSIRERAYNSERRDERLYVCVKKRDSGRTLELKTRGLDVFYSIDPLDCYLETRKSHWEPAYFREGPDGHYFSLVDPFNLRRNEIFQARTIKIGNSAIIQGQPVIEDSTTSRVWRSRVVTNESVVCIRPPKMFDRNRTINVLSIARANNQSMGDGIPHVVPNPTDCYKVQP